jgi:hypothetical protein
MKLKASTARFWGGEKVWSLTQLAKQPDMPVERSYWTLRKWAIEGLEVSGRRSKVKLASFMMGDVRHSTVQAVHEFIAQIGGAP